MKIYSIANMKGGVGKSTISTNVAFHLATRSKTVLIDADPQGNASTYCLTEKPPYELADVLQGDAKPQDTLVLIRENLFLLPTFGLGGLKLYGETQLTTEPFIFEDLNDELQKLGFEYVIYDTSPSMSTLERSVILTCSEVVTPTIPEFFSLDGINIFVDNVHKINKSYRKNVRFSKCVINNVNESIKLHRQIKAEIMNQEGLDYFVIPQDAALKYAQTQNLSIFEYQGEWDKEPGKAKSVQSIRSLAEAL